MNYDGNATGADPADDFFDLDEYDPLAPDELADLAVPHDVGPPAPALAQGAADYNGNVDLYDEADDAGAPEGAPNEAEDTRAPEGAPHEAEDAGAPEGAPNVIFDDAGDEGAPLFLNNAPEGAPQVEQGAAEYDDDDEFDDEGAMNEPDDDINEGATNGDATRYNNLRPHIPVARRFNQAMDEPHNTQTYYPPTQLVLNVADGDLRSLIYEYTLTQMMAKAGIRKHGKAAEAALMTEFAQLEDLSVDEPVAPVSLTKQQRKAALRAINFIREKRDGRLKGRTVADGRPQRNLYEKSETASPTVATNVLMLSIVVDAHEGRDVATADVAGAYLKATMDDFDLLKFTGESVDILCKMNEKKKYVTKEGNVKVLYARLVKALYGCVKSAML